MGVGLVRGDVASPWQPPLWKHTSIWVWLLVLMFFFFGHCLVFNYEVICHDWETCCVWNCLCGSHGRRGEVSKSSVDLSYGWFTWFRIEPNYNSLESSQYCSVLPTNTPIMHSDVQALIDKPTQMMEYEERSSVKLMTVMRFGPQSASL